MGDTIGVATPASVTAMFRACLAAGIPRDMLAGHFHDTYGMALANCLASMQLGVATFDASVAGLGGCPFAKGVSGNMATVSDEILHFLRGSAASLCRGACSGDWWYL